MNQTKIEEGEYIRLNHGVIFKADIDSVYFFNDKKNAKQVKNHDKDIINLIEEDDIVILNYYVSKYRKRIQRLFEVEIIGNDLCFLNHRCSFLYDRKEQKFIDGEGFNIKIKSIVTKEQFANAEYRVEG